MKNGFILFLTLILVNVIGKRDLKKSAERPLSDVQTGAPRNENRFASLNRHRTKKKRLAFSKEKETRRGTSRC